MKSIKKSYRVLNFTKNHNNSEDIDVISEAPVTITVNGEVWLTFMCTPQDLDALAVGFLFTEGIIESIDDVSSVRCCPDGDNVDIWLEHTVDKPQDWSKTSGCTGGLTSVNDTQAETKHFNSANSNGMVVNATRIFGWVDQLLKVQGLYRETGGVHTSGLVDGKKILFKAEDIGRHNTLDKIAGRCLLEKINPEHKIIITTGRVSSEMLYKTLRIGAEVLISRTSPTSLSIELANNYGITLIGYARRNECKIYTHPQRVLLQGDTLFEQKLFS